MDHTELLGRVYRLHWRLRLRNPTTSFERYEWWELRREMYELFKNIPGYEEIKPPSETPPSDQETDVVIPQPDVFQRRRSWIDKINIPKKRRNN